jgi:23S rRNA (guanine2445-N2)-methyltransferase / 23S rRNA (guanine2069-N7)-methyltransferase
MYRELGDALKRGFLGWRAAVITNQDELGRAIGLHADRRYTLYNGALECQLLCFDSVVAPVPREARPKRPLSPGAEGSATAWSRTCASSRAGGSAKA